jgi:hypothetical protein
MKIAQAGFLQTEVETLNVWQAMAVAAKWNRFKIHLVSSRSRYA